MFTWSFYKTVLTVNEEIYVEQFECSKKRKCCSVRFSVPLTRLKKEPGLYYLSVYNKCTRAQTVTGKFSK